MKGFPLVRTTKKIARRVIANGLTALFAICFLVLYVAAFFYVARMFLRAWFISVISSADAAGKEGNVKRVSLLRAIFAVVCRAARRHYQEALQCVRALPLQIRRAVKSGILNFRRRCVRLAYRLHRVSARFRARSKLKRIGVLAVYLFRRASAYLAYQLHRLCRSVGYRLRRAVDSLTYRLRRMNTAMSMKAMSNLQEFWSRMGASLQALEELSRMIARRSVDPQLLVTGIMSALKLGDVKKARGFCALLLRKHEDSFNLHQGAGVQFFLAGYYDDAERIWSESAEIRERTIQEEGLDQLNLRLLGSSWLAAIGHIAHIDIYLKHKILSGNSAQRTVLVPPRGIKIPNQTLLKCWHPYIDVLEPNTHVYGVPNVRIAELLQDEFWSIRIAPGNTRMFSHAAALVQHEWDRREFAPLLRIDPHLEENGWSAMERLGLPKGQWFVCLHVREAGFHQAWHNLHPSTRNADVLSYTKAVNTVIQAGGYVVRMGDNTMQKMPPMQGLIDYAHCDEKDEWLDVFLCAKARFFIGTNSGLGLVPPIFGVPCAMTNWSPIGLPQWYTKDRFIPKMIYSRRKRRLLNFEEMLGTRTGWEQFASYFQSERLDVIDNTPEEIDELVLEMLNSTAGPENVTAPEDQRLRDAYNDFAVSHGSYSGASMGLAFLRKYADWLPRQKLSLADSNDTGRMQARVTMGRRNIKI